MSSEEEKRRARMSWLFVGALFALCLVLGVVQYRWIGEVAAADRDRMRGALQASLNRLSQDFNAEVTSACAALIPAAAESADLEREYTLRYALWKRTTHHGRIFSRVAIVLPNDDEPALRELNLDSGAFHAAGWPENWRPVRERMESRRSAEPWPGRRPPERAQRQETDGLILELPRFVPPREGDTPGPFRRREMDWLIVELNPDYMRDVLFPELLRRHLETGGRLDYQVEVATRGEPRRSIYRSDPKSEVTAPRADASVGLLELQFEQLFRMGPGRGREAGGQAPPEPGPGPRRGFGPDMGRWRMSVRHRAGSLDAVVTAAQWRNLGVTAAVLLLMVATAAALIRFTRSAQKLAEMQMNFVAGVSHELRTPLTVIHTAAYNLRGGVARNPSQVERYGALIHQESERLEKLVDQVLRFANSSVGRVLQKPRPVSVETVVEDAVESTRSEIDQAQCSVETRIDDGLPLVMGDELSLRHAVQNLLSNAAKYGTEGGKWIGVSVSATGGASAPEVEIRVADRGPGIPEDEQEHVFDPFFRGRQAVRDQVRGAGLGLNLVKKIVEAHGGSVSVKSEVMKGAEFIVRLPAAPPEQQDEFTHIAGRG